MSIIEYIFLTVMVCFVASLSPKLSVKEAVSKVEKEETESILAGQKVPWLNLVLISFLLSIYSKLLGITGDLVDRVNYVFSFLYRFPDSYPSLEALWNEKTEPAFILLIQLIRRVTNDPDWFFFFTTFLFVGISVFVLFRISNQYVVGIALFMMSLYYFQSTYLIRQSIAVAFVNLAILSFLENRKLRYFIYVAVAGMFHSTSFIMFPIYFVFKYAETKRIYQIIMISFAVLFIASGPLFETVIPGLPYVGQYIVLENFKYALGDGSPATIIKGFPFYLITFLALLHRNELRDKMKQADVFILSSLLYSMSWLLTYNMYWLFRIGWFLMLPTLILVPELFKVMKDRKERMFFGCIFIVSLLFITVRQLVLELY
jgi:hypothetical protein